MVLERRAEIKRVKIILISLGLIIGLTWAAIFSLPDKQLHLVFCDVGQGDAILISRGSTQILIDGGPNQSVLGCLSNHMPFWDREVEMVVATHSDSDHITGLVDVTERYNVKYFVLNAIGKNTAVFREFQAVVSQEGSEVYFPEQGDEIKIKDLKMAVLWPQSQEKVLGATTAEKEVNETSIVLLLSYGDFEALFPGDISSETEKLLELEDIEVLKVPHHGSKYSTSEEFLSQTQPELAVISVGKNRFGHPTEEVLERLGNQSVKALRTDLNGEIEIVTDGENISLDSSQGVDYNLGR